MIHARPMLDFELRHARFRQEVLQSLEPARGTYIYDACVRDLEEKLSPRDPCGYRRWLGGLLEHLRIEHSPGSLRILDLGCGNGEFTVMMNLMGYDATGVDVNELALGLARRLAEDNGITGDRFVNCSGSRLPFDDRSFDVVTMISTLEHIDDETLAWLVPELARVSRGAVFVQVPSAMKLSDDHTGLKFVPWMPRALAAWYVDWRGPRYRYRISESTRWDVVYRDLREIERRFSSKFTMSIVPPEHSYPRCEPADAVLDIRKKFGIGRTSWVVRVPLLLRHLRKATGTPIENFYPYYNVVFRSRCE